MPGSRPNVFEGVTDYFTELTQTDLADVMRPNLWPNTPDILPSYLQFGGRPAFVVRAVLAMVPGVASVISLTPGTAVSFSTSNA